MKTRKVFGSDWLASFQQEGGEATLIAYLYLARAPRDGALKVGYATDLMSRMKELECEMISHWSVPYDRRREAERQAHMVIAAEAHRIGARNPRLQSNRQKSDREWYAASMDAAWIADAVCAAAVAARPHADLDIDAIVSAARTPDEKAKANILLIAEEAKIKAKIAALRAERAAIDARAAGWDFRL